jgi:hypothetical protein
MSGSLISPHRITGKRIVSRRAYLLQRALQTPQSGLSSSAIASSSSAKVDEKPWPRYIVYGAWCTAGIVIPYTIAWFLSMNAEWRSRYPFSTLFGDTGESASGKDDNYDSEEDGKLVQILRRHFGVPDIDHLSEPEQLESSAKINNFPFRFIDEPSRAVRWTQKDIERRKQSQVFVQLYKIPKPSSTTNTLDGEEASMLKQPSLGQQLRQKLPASILARTSDIQAALIQNNDYNLDQNETRNQSKDILSSWYWAIEFLRSDDDDNQEKIDKNETDEESTESTSATAETTGTFPWTIYSAWQYHHLNHRLISGNGDGNSDPKSQQVDSAYDLEMARIDHEIQRLRDSVHERSVDDVSIELQQLQSEKRKLRFQKWFSFWRS